MRFRALVLRTAETHPGNIGMSPATRLFRAVAMLLFSGVFRSLEDRPGASSLETGKIIFTQDLRIDHSLDP